jgi:hypothetical protein
MLFVAAATSGCASNPEKILSDEKAKAVQTAVQRGRFEMDCPKATGTVLSSNMLQPIVWGGMERAEYTIGVEGCSKRSTYIVVCQIDSVSCFAASGQQNMRIDK